MPFGGAEKIESVFGSERDGKGAGIGEADVLTGHAHHAPREVERVFAGFEHAREPIEGRVGIGVADGFVQRGDEVVMLFAGLVVAEKFALEDVFEEFRRDDSCGIFIGTCSADGQFERVISSAGVAIREGSNAKEHVF